MKLDLDKANIVINYQKLKKTDRPLDPFYHGRVSLARHNMHMFPSLQCRSGVRMGFGKKVWKVRNARLDGGCTHIVKGTLKGMVCCRGIRGAFQCFSGSFYPYPQPLKNLSRYTLISRMVQGVGKKSEDSVPCRCTKRMLCAFWTWLFHRNNCPIIVLVHWFCLP